VVRMKRYMKVFYISTFSLLTALWIRFLLEGFPSGLSYFMVVFVAPGTILLITSFILDIFELDKKIELGVVKREKMY